MFEKVNFLDYNCTFRKWVLGTLEFDLQSQSGLMGLHFRRATSQSGSMGFGRGVEQTLASVGRNVGVASLASTTYESLNQLI